MSVQPLFFAAARALLRLSELSAAVSGRMNALTVFSISGSAVGSEDSAVFPQFLPQREPQARRIPVESRRIPGAARFRG